MRAPGWQLVLAACLLTTACSSGTSVAIPRPPRDVQAAQLQAAQRGLSLLGRAVAHDDPSAAGTLAPAGDRLAQTIVTNAHLLGVRDLQLQYVAADDEPPTAKEQRLAGSGSWWATVQASYRLPEDSGPTSMSIAVLFARGAGGTDGTARIAAIGGRGHRSALWLDGPVHVARTRTFVLITTAAAAQRRYLPWARTAARTVDGVLGRQGPPLVFEVPTTQTQLEGLIDAKPGTYDKVAGVTAVVDGSLASDSPVHSFFNPDLMAQEKARGAQLVVTHEATLQATRSPVRNVPIWLFEGFADYVALLHLGVPLHTAAGELIRQVRHHGPPRRLPTDADFNTVSLSLDRLNATYEEAWLACRYLSERWGQPTLLSVYRAVDRGETFGRAFAAATGSTRAAFVAGWRDYLTAVAAGATPAG